MYIPGVVLLTTIPSSEVSPLGSKVVPVNKAVPPVDVLYQDRVGGLTSVIIKLLMSASSPLASEGSNVNRKLVVAEMAPAGKDNVAVKSLPFPVIVPTGENTPPVEYSTSNCVTLPFMKYKLNKN